MVVVLVIPGRNLIGKGVRGEVEIEIVGSLNIDPIYFNSIRDVVFGVGLIYIAECQSALNRIHIDNIKMFRISQRSKSHFPGSKPNEKLIER